MAEKAVEWLSGPGGVRLVSGVTEADSEGRSGTSVFSPEGPTPKNFRVGPILSR